MATLTRASVGELGIALQSAEGTGLGTAAFAHPLVSGLPRPVETTDEIEVSVSSGDLIPGLYKKEQHWEMDATFWATPRATGAWVKAMLGAISTSGGGDPYTHSLTNGTPPFITAFATAPGGVYRKFVDGTISELTFTFAKGEPLMLGVKAQGYTPSTLGTAYTSTVTEPIATSGNWFTMIGATTKFDLDATPAASTVTTVEGGSITLSREVELHQATALNPSNRELGRFRVAVALDTVFTNYNAYAETYYGGTAGTSSSATVVAGAVNIAFAQGPTSSANRTLTIDVPNVALRVPDVPDVDPSGKALMVPLAGMTYKPSSGEIVTVTLKSQDSTY